MNPQELSEREEADGQRESAWEREDNQVYGCEHGYPYECAAPAGWRFKAAFTSSGALRDEYRMLGPLGKLTTRWACDEHKIEPQPPSYKEWLEREP